MGASSISSIRNEQRNWIVKYKGHMFFIACPKIIYMIRRTTKLVIMIFFTDFVTAVAAFASAFDFICGGTSIRNLVFGLTVTPWPNQSVLFNFTERTSGEV